MHMSCSADTDVNVTSWGPSSTSFCASAKKALASLRVSGLMAEYVCSYGLAPILKHMLLR